METANLCNIAHCLIAVGSDLISNFHAHIKLIKQYWQMKDSDNIFFFLFMSSDAMREARREVSGMEINRDIVLSQCNFSWQQRQEKSLEMSSIWCIYWKNSTENIWLYEKITIGHTSIVYYYKVYRINCRTDSVCIIATVYFWVHCNRIRFFQGAPFRFIKFHFIIFCRYDVYCSEIVLNFRIVFFFLK